jgi:hypothetical protein
MQKGSHKPGGSLFRISRTGWSQGQISNKAFLNSRFPIDLEGFPYF